MKVEFLIPLRATALTEKYRENGIEKGRSYEVEEINMGQTNTRICIPGRRRAFNSVHFEFTVGGKKIDLYNSGAFNHYRRFSLPLIKFVGDGK